MLILSSINLYMKSSSQTPEDLPLVSFVLLAYNQEGFIHEAVEGAFSQTYEPLEIILSDDCSMDSTYEIMRAMAAGYIGPHKVVVRRNENNQGIGKHFNSAVAASTGQFIAVAAGDDVSLPDRSETMFDEWNLRGRPVCSMHSAMIYTDEAGNYLKSELPVSADGLLDTIRSGQGVWGASHCFHRSVFDGFGPFRYPIVFEDFAMSVRAQMLGGVVAINKELVRYRKHMNDWGGDIYNGSSLQEVLSKNSVRVGVDILMLDQLRLDLAEGLKHERISRQLYSSCLAACRVRYRRSRAKQLASSLSWWSRFSAIGYSLIPPYAIRDVYHVIFLAIFPAAYMRKMANAKRLAITVIDDV